MCYTVLFEHIDVLKYLKLSVHVNINIIMSFIVTQYRYKDIVGYGKVVYVCVCVCAEQHYYRP